MNDQDRISALEKEVRRLKITLETLVTVLNVSQLGPPNGRAAYDLMVREALTKEGL